MNAPDRELRKLGAANAAPRGVGARLPLIDGVEKVTGTARYTADLPAQGALVGKLLRSPYAHAELLEVDISEALKLPGVRGIVTGNDCDTPYGVIPIAQNEFPLARGRIRYVGEPVAAVAAVDEATTDAALALIRLKVRELPAYFDAADARKADVVLLHDNKKGNIEREVHNEFGDAAAGFAAADLICEETFECAEVHHAMMEPNASLAAWDNERGHLTLWSVTQVPYYVHESLARCMKLDAAYIRVIKPFVGGGFGHRVETLNFEIIAGLLARAARGTVRLLQTREEAFLTHRGRPQTYVRMKLGLTRDGRMTACEAEVVQRGGAYGGYGLVTILYAGALLNGLYDLPAVKYDGYRVYTNTPPCGAMRGHGTVNIRFAFESLLDMMAAELGLDAFAVRRRNLLKAPTETINGLKVMSYGLPECLDWVEQASGWRERAARLEANSDGPIRRGIGIACSHFVSGSAKPVHFTGQPHATIALRVDFDAGITILTGASDIGQGSSTIITQVVAEILGVEYRRLRLIATDSALTPKDNGSYSSRVTFMVGNAAADAARNLKAVLVAAAAKRLQVAEADVDWLGEAAAVVGDASRQIPFHDIVEEALVDVGMLTVKGTFTCPPEFQGGKQRGGAVGSTMGFSYAAQAVEVSVDTELGKVTVEKVWSAIDCGFAINPMSVEGQVQGAIWMGMGQAISEETVYENGRHKAVSLLDYRVPTIIESPDIAVHIVESLDPNGPFGAKEASEGPLAGVMSAIAAAIEDATGTRIRATPFTPDRVFDALNRKPRPGAHVAAAAKGAA
ncbi:4-hydroxybenzoyl-CoA reductase, alpha subunit [Aromatoleum aromaticum EbN1]|uniref:4-hydroxybenzoyl-CoA reductase, alpha subunit n=1 Tax=Aromatoleum aromaticum (strain DSM 19018 / LMG 30748 / EbN1) TaxID=76114 RepID=Q5P3F3_AROAE|nr:4-hydroxybenzoyl-CoA reductase subunit alpha [Aromatoleum aromaticum]CAI08161.1 4-hydroxybenzoyl-CoA reductase, alpha subunit [Aromatoleum aromaticum EbN1]